MLDRAYSVQSSRDVGLLAGGLGVDSVVTSNLEADSFQIALFIQS